MSANPFTQYYGQLLHQGNMLADHIRTSTYQQAFLRNAIDFQDKVVLDVGTGTGILSFFAVQAGAKKVYAVEASESAITAMKLVEANGYGDVIEVIRGKIEEVELPEPVDVIVSEPIGFLLVHERMLESYVVARDRFLKPGGLMMPSTGSIVLAPYSDDNLYKEQLGKIAFWKNSDFYGVDLSSIEDQAQQEYFTQAVVGNFSVDALLSSQRVVHSMSFAEVSCEELQNFDIEFTFRIDKTALMHGIAGWFDIAFLGSTETVVLSTAPECPCTHWYQCRLMFSNPIAVNKGQFVSGTLKFMANEKFSYYVSINAQLDGTDVETSCVVSLHDQMYSYLSS